MNKSAIIQIILATCGVITLVVGIVNQNADTTLHASFDFFMASVIVYAIGG